jgi:hypothetical protein
LSLLSVAFPSLLIYGGVGLDHIGGHTRAPTKPCESGVYDSGGACDLRLSEDPASPVQAGGYVIACTVFYERGFSVPTHRFLCSLLQFYGLEVHHLTPSEILHMAAFVTLCEAYMGIEPHLNIWNNFFRALLQQGSGTETTTLCNVDIFVRSGPGVDPYFRLPMSDPSVGWWNVQFFLRNDADAPLPVFTGSHPIPQPKWGYSVAQMDLRRLHPLCEVI